MKNMELIRGIGIGLVAGTTIGFAVAPKRGRGKSTAERILRTVGDVVENLGEALR